MRKTGKVAKRRTVKRAVRRLVEEVAATSGAEVCPSCLMPFSPRREGDGFYCSYCRYRYGP